MKDQMEDQEVQVDDFSFFVGMLHGKSEVLSSILSSKASVRKALDQMDDNECRDVSAHALKNIENGHKLSRFISIYLLEKQSKDDPMAKSLLESIKASR